MPLQWFSSSPAPRLRDRNCLAAEAVEAVPPHLTPLVVEVAEAAVPLHPLVAVEVAAEAAVPPHPLVAVEVAAEAAVPPHLLLPRHLPLTPPAVEVAAAAPQHLPQHPPPLVAVVVMAAEAALPLWHLPAVAAAPLTLHPLTAVAEAAL